VKTLVSFAIGVVSASFAARVAAQNVEVMAKWTAAEIVHYDVVMEFAGEAQILGVRAAQYLKAPVKDRVELAFDWNQGEMKIVGTPVIKNFPSTTGAPAAVEGCPAPRVTGTYEHATVAAVTGFDYNPLLQLTATRTFAAGSIPSRGETACDVWTDSPAATEPAEAGLMVLPSMYLGMPSSGDIKVDAARSTITNVQEGWTNTYKLSIK
jgi:hypothetical protein